MPTITALERDALSLTRMSARRLSSGRATVEVGISERRRLARRPEIRSRKPLTGFLVLSAVVRRRSITALDVASLAAMEAVGRAS